VLVQKKLELTVGTKGEIYTSEEIRRAVGIEPRSVVVAEVGERQLILRPKESAEHLLEKPRFKVPPVSPKQLSKLRRKLAVDLGAR
jgi:bifunctional DNA-binding transcriptional regulator/antitoxin component of YhaV-PrlF toxin-antitoxin module